MSIFKREAPLPPKVKDMHVPTFRLHARDDMLATIRRLTATGRTLYFHALSVGSYLPPQRIGYDYACIEWEGNYFLYSLTVDGRLATLEAVVEQIVESDQ